MYGAPPDVQQAMADGSGATSPVSQAARNVDSTSFSQWLDRAMNKTGTALKDVGQFVNQNKGLTDMALGAVNGAFGPQAQMAKMQRDQLDYQRSLMERARANLNAPVALRYQPPQG
jgi:aminopeptidase C